MNNLDLSQKDLDFLFSPACIRQKAKEIFEITKSGNGYFEYHAENLIPTVEYVISVIEKNYPDLNIPFHSRWGHFRAGKIDRSLKLNSLLQGVDSLEKARSKLDLVITSVLLDAGAGASWKYFEEDSKKYFDRSEGLGVASFYMFLSGIMSSDKKSLKADISGLKNVTENDLKKYFQVTNENPLVGVSGRVQLLNNLSQALENKTIFSNGRPGNILDYLEKECGKTIPAPKILKAVIEGIGPIWPGRLKSNDINLGDVWKYSKIKSQNVLDTLVPFHKLSQWMTYSLIEPIIEAGFNVTDVEGLTGLAEYRNGGLILDSKLVTLKNSEHQNTSWAPDSDLIIEWRALTIHLLDLIGNEVQKRLNKTPSEFPLAKVLEGGTWWAGRFIAKEKRNSTEPPIKIISDGTVF